MKLEKAPYWIEANAIGRCVNLQPLKTVIELAALVMPFEDFADFEGFVRECCDSYAEGQGVNVTVCATAGRIDITFQEGVQ